MVQRWSVLMSCVVVLALGAPAVAEAATPPPGIPGISVVRIPAYHAPGRYDVRFADRAASVYRGRVAGRWVRIGCSRLSADGTWATVEETATRTFRAPRRRSTLRLEVDRGFRADSCYVQTGKDSPIELPVTALGRRHFDEQATYVTLFTTQFFATKRSGEPATMAEAVAAGHGILVALAGPDAAPPAGPGGYWTDGRRSVFAAVTSSGQRMFLETGLDGVVRTNALNFLQADDDTCGEYAAVGRIVEDSSCGPDIVLGGAG